MEIVRKETKSRSIRKPVCYNDAAMKTNELIDINKVSYEESKKYQWKAIEPMQRKGDQWSQRCECKKTGAKGIRRGFFL